MIKLHHIFKLVFGFAMVEFCRFFYYRSYSAGPSYSRLSTSAPSISAENQKLLNITPSSKYTGLYQVGDQNIYLSGNKAYQQNQSGLMYLEPLGTNTRFKEYTGDIKGLNYDKDAATYSPSMAYLSALQRAQTPYTPFSAQQAPMSVLGYNPAVMSSIYSPASSSNLLSMPSGQTSYGAGRFLGSGLLGSPISFTVGDSSNNSGGTP
jgi:hypothetical protein